MNESEGFISDLFNTELNINPYMDLNELNPIGVYSAGVSCLYEYCRYPMGVRYRLSDGVGVVNRENLIKISQLGEGDGEYQGDQPYCWSFE